jgi:ubiquinone/menaquinone biosynthesis C-methylase UbiE
MKKHLWGVSIFDVGARAYDFFTANQVWLTNCGRLLDPLPPSRGPLRVLDLGVGPGGSALTMGQQHFAAWFIGLDISQPMLTLAANNRLKANWSPERLSLICADAFHLPLADESMDAVTGHSFLYLLPDYRIALSEAKRVLCPKGYVAFLEPHAGHASWSWLWKQTCYRLLISISGWRFYSGLHRRFSPESMRHSLAQAGFVHITTEVTLGGFGIFGRAQKP